MAGKKDVRFGMIWTAKEAEAVKEWCWQNRVKSTSAAIRAFIAHGIAVQPPIEVYEGKDEPVSADLVEKRGGGAK